MWSGNCLGAVDVAGREATMKLRGVVVAMRQGHSCAPPGHEIAGTIDAVGQVVVPWQRGQRVGVGWFGGNLRAL